MDPSIKRNLSWAGGDNPRVSSVPIDSEGDQPLYGLGVNGLKPVYERSEIDRANICY